MNVLLLIAAAFYSIAVLHSILTLLRKRRILVSVSLGSLSIGLIFHTASILGRGMSASRFPLVGMQEAFSFLAWAIVVYYLIAYSLYRVQALSSFLFPLIFIWTLIAAFLPAPQDAPATIRGEWNTWLFPVHTTLILFSYASFFVMFVAGVMYLIQEREIKLKRFGLMFFRLPSLDTCDDISYKSLTIGFVLLTLGIITGMIWGSQRDGRLWHNDPKEIIAAATWLIYLLVMHYRLTAGWRGRRAALLAIAGFALIIFSLVGARYLGGYHAF